MSKAIEDVMAERQRQRNVEGWTVEHDDEHQDQSLAQAAAAYTQHYFQRGWLMEAKRPEGPDQYKSDPEPSSWPRSWARRHWKPKTPRRDLVRAAALLIAEIERLDRADQPVSTDSKQERCTE